MDYDYDNLVGDLLILGASSSLLQPTAAAPWDPSLFATPDTTAPLHRINSRASGVAAAATPAGLLQGDHFHPIAIQPDQLTQQDAAQAEASDDWDELIRILDQAEQQVQPQQPTQPVVQDSLLLPDPPGMAADPRPYEVVFDKTRRPTQAGVYQAEASTGSNSCTQQQQHRHLWQQQQQQPWRQQQPPQYFISPPSVAPLRPGMLSSPPAALVFGPPPVLFGAPPTFVAVQPSAPRFTDVDPGRPCHQDRLAAGGSKLGKIKLRSKAAAAVAGQALRNAELAAAAKRARTAAAADAASVDRVPADSAQQTASSGQPSASCKAAALQLLYHHGAATSSRATPEQYFRQHAPLTNPFWASAIADDVGLVACAHLSTASPEVAAAAPAGQQVVKCSMNIMLSSSQLNMLKNNTAKLQLACLLMGDVVSHRCHWPGNAQLTVNGFRVALKLAKRMQSQKLKPNQVDMPADISANATGTVTCVQLNGIPSGMGYVLGARLVRQQSVDRVKLLMGQTPTLEAALANVKQKMSADGDVEVSATTISLRCPLSSCHITTPARFTSSQGLPCASCFDLGSFLGMAQQSSKWQCPVSMALVTVGQLVVEPYLAAVLQALKAADLLGSVEDVEISPDGTWRPKGAASGCPWFDVLHPPKPPALRDAFRGTAAGGIKRRRTAEDEAEGILERQRKQQRQDSSPATKAPAAAAAAAGGVAGATAAAAAKHDVLDLTLDSDDEPPGAATRTQPPAAAAGAAANPQPGISFRIPSLNHVVAAGGAARRQVAAVAPVAPLTPPAARRADSEFVEIYGGLLAGQEGDGNESLQAARRNDAGPPALEQQDADSQGEYASADEGDEQFESAEGESADAGQAGGAGGRGFGFGLGRSKDPLQRAQQVFARRVLVTGASGRSQQQQQQQQHSRAQQPRAPAAAGADAAEYEVIELLSDDD